MEFEEFEEEEMERQLPVARHEFGHYTVARFLGFEAEDVKLAAKATFGGVAGTAGLKLLHPLITSDDILKYCESRIKILFAGVLAEALENGVIKNDNAILYAENLRLKFQVQHPAPFGHRMLRWADEASTSAARNVA